MSSCRPEEHIIQLDKDYQIHVVIDKEWGHQIYVPKHLGETGQWVSLGAGSITIVEARNDCAQHAGRQVIE